MSFIFFFFFFFFLPIYISPARDVTITYPNEKTHTFQNAKCRQTILLKFNGIISNCLHIVTENKGVDKNIGQEILFHISKEEFTRDEAILTSSSIQGPTHMYIPSYIISSRYEISFIIFCGGSQSQYTLSIDDSPICPFERNNIYSYSVSEKVYQYKFKVEKPVFKNKEFILLISVLAGKSVNTSVEKVIENNNNIYDNNSKIEKINITKKSTFGDVYTIFEEINQQYYYYLISINTTYKDYITLAVKSFLKHNETTYYTKMKINNGPILGYFDKIDKIKSACYELDNIEYYVKKNISVYTLYPESLTIFSIIDNLPTKDTIICFKKSYPIYYIELNEYFSKIKNKSLNYPLYAGFPYKRKQNKDNIIYYNYLPNNPTGNNMYYSLNSLQGIISSISYICNDFPHCSSSKDIAPSIRINSFYLSHYFITSAYSDKQCVLFVECKVGDCEYDYSAVGEGEIIKLKEGRGEMRTIFKNIININSREEYDINLKNNEEYNLTEDLYEIYIGKNNSGQVIIDIWEGRDKVKFLEGNIKVDGIIKPDIYSISYDFITGKQQIIYTKKTTEILGSTFISFKIKYNPSTLYYIKYRVINNNTYEKIEDKILHNITYVLEEIGMNKQEKIKINEKLHVIFKKLKTEEKLNNYYINLHSKNCELSVLRKDNLTISPINDIHMDIIKTDNPYYHNDYFEYIVEPISINMLSYSQSTSDCILDIESNIITDSSYNYNYKYNNLEKNEIKEIMLSEGIISNFILSKNMNIQRFLLLFYDKKDKFLEFNLDFKGNYGLNITIFDENNLYFNEFLSSKRGFFINNTNMCNKTGICRINVEIRIANENYDINDNDENYLISFSYSSSSITPILLSQGQLFSFVSPKNNIYSKKYFYYEFSNTTDLLGELSIDGNNKHAKIYGKIIKKFSNETNANWGNIRFPIEEKDTNLIYDVKSKKIILKKEDLNKCQNEECLLLITYDNSNSNKESYYSIYLRTYNDKTQSTIKIPINQYVYSTIESKCLKSNIYKIYLENNNLFYPETDCLSCLFEVYDKNKAKLLEFLGNSPKIIKNNQNSYLTIKVSIPNSLQMIRYYLNVREIISSNKKQKTLFNIDKAKSFYYKNNLNKEDFTYFIMPLRTGDDTKFNDDIRVNLMVNIDDIGKNNNIYYNFINANIIEKFDVNEIENNLPDEHSDYGNGKMFVISKDKIQKDRYIIFGIKTIPNILYKFYISFSNEQTKKIYNHYYYPSKIYYVPKEEITLKLNFSLEYPCQIQITKILGNLNISSQDNILNNVVIPDSMIINFEKNDNKNFLLEIKSTSNNIENNDFSMVIYVNQIIQIKKFNVMQIDYLMNTKAEYIKHTSTSNFFVYLPNNHQSQIVNKIKKVNTINDYSISQHNLKDREYFLSLKFSNLIDNYTNCFMKSVFIKESELFNAFNTTNDTEIFYNESAIIYGSFDFQPFKAHFSYKNLTNDMNLLYVKIDCGENEKNFDIDIDLIPMNGLNYPIKTDMYVDNELHQKNIKLHLLDFGKSTDKIALYLSANKLFSHHLDFALVDYENKDKEEINIFKKNSTKIKILNNEEKFNYHRLVFKLTENTTRYIILSIFGKTDNDNLNDSVISYSLKYKNYDINSDIASLTLNEKVTTEIKNSILKITVPDPTIIPSPTSPKFHYRIKLFEESKINETRHTKEYTLNTISNLENIFGKAERTVFFESNLGHKTGSIEISNLKQTKYNGQLVVLYEKENLLVNYESIMIDNKEIHKSNLRYVILIISFLFILSLIIFGCCWLKNTNSEDLENTISTTSFISLEKKQNKTNSSSNSGDLGNLLLG